VTDIFPSDAVAKAKKYLDAIHTTGAYSESNGATVFREEIAAALQVRGAQIQTCSFLSSRRADRPMASVLRRCVDQAHALLASHSFLPAPAVCSRLGLPRPSTCHARLPDDRLS